MGRRVERPPQTAEYSTKGSGMNKYKISSLMFIGPCIILIVEYKETNLMSLALLFHYLMFNMFRMLIHPSSGACDLFVGLFHGLYCSGSMCGVVSIYRPQPAHGYHTTTAKPQRNTSTHRTRAIQPMK